MKNKKTFALIYMNADCLCEGFVFSNFPEINNKKDILLISHDERSWSLLEIEKYTLIALIPILANSHD